MKRIAVKMLMLSLVVGLSGCASIGDGVISCEMGIRNRVLAQKAWGHWSWCYDKLEYPYHFARGFKAGYRDVLDGGAGCQPTLPPQCYWKPTYQTPEGRCKTNAWFDGFSHGALAGKQDGYGDMSEIPISPTARLNLEMAQMPPQQDLFMDGHYPSGQYPNGQYGNAEYGGVVLPDSDANILVQPPTTERGVFPPAIGGTPAAGENVPMIPVPTRPYE